MTNDTPIKVCIGLSTNRGVKAQTVASLVNTAAAFRFELHFVAATDGISAAENRTYIVQQAIGANCSHILFVDDDMVFNPDTLTRLLGHNKRIVGTAPNMRVVPPHTTVKFQDEKGEYLAPHLVDFPMPGELFKAHAVGTGLLLVETSVFEEIGRPWFQFELSEAGFVLVGEDVFFCRQAHAKGIDVWCDPTIKVGHIGDYTY